MFGISEWNSNISDINIIPYLILQKKLYYIYITKFILISQYFNNKKYILQLYFQKNIQKIVNRLGS